jgi:glycosyltransferase involved in cell wall biosynthesis
MTFLIDIRLLTTGRVSGVEEYTRNLMSALIRRAPNDRFELLYNGFRKAPLPSEWLNAPNVRVIDRRIPNKLFDLAARTIGFPRANMFTRDATLAFTPHLNPLRVSAPMKRIVTFHDISFIHFPEFFPLRKRLWLWLQDYRREARRADALVVDCAFTRQDIVETLHVPAERIHVITPGIDPRYRPFVPGEFDGNAFRRMRGIRSPFLLFSGVLEPRKNIEGVIRAFTRLKRDGKRPGLALVIVGDRGWLYDRIFNEARRSTAFADIVFWGHAAPEDLRALYTLAEAFVYPSFFEGFGFPPLEAQSCGAPVIVSNRSTLPEVIGASGILVDPWDTDALAAALESVLDDRSLRDELIRRGYRNVTRFSWDTAADSLLALFRSITHP